VVFALPANMFSSRRCRLPNPGRSLTIFVVTDILKTGSAAEPGILLPDSVCFGLVCTWFVFGLR